MFAFHSLLQAAVAIGDVSDSSRALLYAAGLIVVGLIGWMVKVTRDVSKAVTRLTDYLFGFKGDNGLNSEVKQLRKDVDRLLDRGNAPSESRLYVEEQDR